MEFSVYESCLESVVNLHKGVTEKLKLSSTLIKYLKDAHLKYIGEKYHNFLTGFLEFDTGDDRDKKQYFSFYANEYKEKIKKEIFPSSFMSSVIQMILRKKKKTAGGS